MRDKHATEGYYEKEPTPQKEVSLEDFMGLR